MVFKKRVETMEGNKISNGLSIGKVKLNSLKKIFCVMISLVIIMSFSSCSSSGGGDVYTAYYNDSTVPGAFKTYINALMSDDYDTYLKITRKSDSESSKRSFNVCKEGYVGMESVSYGEVKTDTIFGAGAAAEYMVAEYNDNGTQKKDYNFSSGRDYSYGLIIIKETQWDSGVYYVAGHHPNYNFYS